MQFPSWKATICVTWCLMSASSSNQIHVDLNFTMQYRLVIRIYVTTSIPDILSMLSIVISPYNQDYWSYINLFAFVYKLSCKFFSNRQNKFKLSHLALYHEWFPTKDELYLLITLIGWPLPHVDQTCTQVCIITFLQQHYFDLSRCLCCKLFTCSVMLTG